MKTLHARCLMFQNPVIPSKQLVIYFVLHHIFIYIREFKFCWTKGNRTYPQKKTMAAVMTMLTMTLPATTITIAGDICWVDCTLSLSALKPWAWFTTEIIENFISRKSIRRQERLTAWPQEAYRPPCSKYSLCCSVSGGGGTWVPAGGLSYRYPLWGTPSWDWDTPCLGLEYLHS